MANIALITTILKAITAFWSLLVLAVSAGMIARFNQYGMFHSSSVSASQVWREYIGV